MKDKSKLKDIELQISFEQNVENISESKQNFANAGNQI